MNIPKKPSLNTLLLQSMVLPAFLSLLFLSTAQAEKKESELPENSVWLTNIDEPVFEDYNPQKGGTFRDYLSSYPLTFRLYGPNSNSGAFVSYNRRYALMGLTSKHPNTGKSIPELATHWQIMPDNRTVFYKLDPDARWSDGEKITADDYVFTYEFYRSKHIQAPFYNQYARDNFEIIEKIDDYTLKVVTKKPSWRILDSTSINPLPRHAIKLDSEWVKRYQWSSNVVPGPYTLKKFKKGKYVEFHRIKNWWGEKKRYFKNRFHFDKIRLTVTREQTVAFELFKKEKISFFTPRPIQWEKKTDFSSIQKGYIHKQRIYTDVWSGLSGIFFNTQKGIWADKRLRQALSHTLDFESINKNIFFGLYERKQHFFDVFSPYRHPNLKTYSYDLKKAEDLLDEAGWKRTNVSQGFREKNSQRLSLTIHFSSEVHKKYLTFLRETARKAGIELNLELRDGATFFKGVNQRDYAAFILGFGGSRYPSPRQMLHTENIRTNTNNIIMFGSPEIDQWIDIFEFDQDEKKRIQAIYDIEETIHENAPVILFWKDPTVKLLWWRYIKGPKTFIYKTGFDHDLLYYDAKEHEMLKAAVKKDETFDKLPEIYDPYNIRK